MLTAYGAFCSRHKDAVAVYKEMLKAEKKFALFIAVSRFTATPIKLLYFK